MTETRQFSESPSSARAKDEVLDALHGANYIDVMAIQRSENVLPSKGLCTTMLSTKELSERGR